MIDTNAALDWLVFRDARIAPLVRRIESRTVTWLASLAMREELNHMLGHASLQRWFPERERALSVFDTWAVLQPPPVARALPMLRCSDPDDQIFIDLALACGARWLVTHDRALLKLARRAHALGVEILTPQAWCARHGQPAD